MTNAVAIRIMVETTEKTTVKSSKDDSLITPVIGRINDHYLLLMAN